ncbi:hypothetical protein SLEP1_g17692 [Rubroshorea leprosula]|uniref:Glutathione S-transferase n=1 Tax=Rubroshorea leprosula TaxID=152421 RepID=A0AAV5J466_9ROSI|nr:hypothetical protein SLEP1_g17692 [Rubroshorea leprosula]
MAEELKLFKKGQSPYGLRIVWALKLKGIQFDPVDEDLSNKSSLPLQYNPVHNKIPVLVMPSMWNAFKLEGQEQEEAIGSAMENLQVLEEELRGKKFFGGEKINWIRRSCMHMAGLLT